MRSIPFLLCLIFFVAVSPLFSVALAVGNITVDFSSKIRDLSPLQIGMDESGYGVGKVNIVTDPLQRTRLSTLKVALMRMNLKYATSGDANSQIVCGGAGCDTTQTGSQWIANIKAVGAEPLVEVPLNVPDAVNLVKHFNINAATKNYVKYWVVWNEPDGQGVSVGTYSSSFNQIYDAMKAIDPTIIIGGPATAYFNTAYLQTFLNTSGSRTDFVDYHEYGQGGDNILSDSALLSGTSKYTSNPQQLRTMMNNTIPSRSASVPIHIGEWNMSWTTDNRMYTNFNTVWGASVLGRQLKEGIWSRQYADKNGGLGALYESDDAGHNSVRDDEMPIYHGLGMFTGESIFPKFGTSTVNASTTLANLEIYASNNPKNIVVVNKDPLTSRSGTFTLTGVSSGVVDVYQKNQSTVVKDAPVKLASTNIVAGEFSYSLPPYSVTTFVITGSAGPSPSPSALPSPTPTPTPSGSTVVATIEAESGTITTPFVMSGGMVSQTSGNTDPALGGKATYTVNIPTAGDYIIKGMVDAVNESSNSFFINFDAEPTDPLMIWDFSPGVTVGLEQRTVSWRGNAPDASTAQFRPKVFTLTAGNHTLILRGREANAKVDKFTIEKVTTGGAGIAGDINNSGKVDIFDFNLLLTDYGATSGVGLRSDINLSGKVDIFDYNILLTNFGNTSP